MLRHDELKQVTNRGSSCKSGSNQRASAGPTECNIFWIFAGTIFVLGQTFWYYEILEESSHTKVVDIEPARRVKAERQTLLVSLIASTRASRSRPQAGVPLVVLEIHIQEQATAHDQQAPRCHSSWQVSFDKDICCMDSANDELHDLHLADPGFSHKRYPSCIDQRQGVVQIDDKLAGTVHRCRKVRVSTTCIATNKEPAPRVNKPQEDVKKRHLVELLSEYHKERVHKFQLGTVVLAPEPHAKSIA
mmetsp:Transcript_25003/g.48845  ORF Transcript_25003/g.48845 Transcript_25003/m.48845 type:complete len:247 (-) Transcript_25003:586-1326(-)